MYNVVQEKKIQSEKSHKASSKTGIPQNMQNSFEASSGYSFDDVHVHYNSDKPAQLQALAYTKGNQVYIGPGQERHLKHELGHVVQQKQQRVKPTVSFKGININDSSYMEREADSIASKAFLDKADNSTFQVPLKSYSEVIQRQPFEQPFKNLNLHNNSKRWFEIAEDFEQRLGVYSYQDNRAAQAVTSGLFKIFCVLSEAGGMNDIPDEAKIHDENIDDIKRTFFKDDNTSAGQVGVDHDLDEIDSILFRGNLREKMTAFYNAAYYNCGYGTGVRGLKALLHNIIFNKRLEKVRELKLDEDEYKKAAAYFDGSYYRGIVEQLIKTFGPDKAYLFSKDLFAMGNISSLSDNWIKDLYEITLSQMERFERDEEGRADKAKSEQDYEDMGVPLSEDELKFLFSYRYSSLYDLFTTAAEKAADRAEDKERPLPWLEGVKLFDIKPESSWFREVHDELKIPVVAGVSGTTARMLTAFKFLNVEGITPLDFRLAIMGWMLTGRDHSLYEILRGSHMVGIKPPGEEEGVKDVTRMYVNIAPLSKAELRGIADHGMFPHELMYKELSEGLDRYLFPEMPGAIPDLTAAKANLGLNHYYDALNDAHAIAVRSYTTGMHVLLNTVLAYPERHSVKGRAAGFIGSSAEDKIYKELHKQVMFYMDNGLQPGDWIEVLTPFIPALDYFRTLIGADLKDAIGMLEKNLREISSELYTALKLHSNIVFEGLEELPPYIGTVYRGDWRGRQYSNYNVGETVTLGSFTSYSKDINTAAFFAEQYTEGWFSGAVLIRLTLNGIYGKDISKISEYPGEQEVLLSPGDKIRYVAQSTYNTGVRQILMLDAVEV